MSREDVMAEWECVACKAVWFSQYYEEMPELGYPNFCPSCGSSVDYILMEEE